MRDEYTNVVVNGLSKMIIVPNNIIPFSGFCFINLFGVLFVRRDMIGHIKEKDYNHEMIHTAQMKELLYIGFYIAYLFEWLYRLVFHTKTAYRGLSFEREAYDNEENLNYLNTRKRFAQWKTHQNL